MIASSPRSRDLRGAGKPSPRITEPGLIEGRLHQQDEPLHPEALERRARRRVALEVGLPQAAEYRHDEAGWIVAARGVLVARDADQFAEARVSRLGVEAVGVTAGDRRHARTEAADD